MIYASDLIAKVREAYEADWGYIYGTRGQLWTQAMQDKATRAMTVKYGQQWVGRRVADCSGLIKWAYNQLGEDIYHGSNTMFSRCTETGPLAGEVRIRVGTAVFQNSSGKRGHVGIYNGGGMVIEEHGTQAGIIKSPLSTWDEWGVLPDTDLSAEVWETFDIVPMDTLTKGASGELVKYLQRGLIEAGYDVGDTGADGKFGSETLSAVRAFQSDKGLTADGKVGTKTWAAIKAVLEDDEPDEDTEVDFDEGEETPSAPDGAAPPKVEPQWDSMTLEEKVEDLHQWRLSMQGGGETNGS